MNINEKFLGRCGCYLCDAEAYLLTPYSERLVERIHCPYCGKYGITVQVIDCKTYKKTTRSLVSGKVFDSFFYNQEEKIVDITDFDTEDITETEKIFRLAKYFYTATIRGIELEAIPASCYESNSLDFCDKLETLERKGIIKYNRASKFEDSGDYASHFFDIRMTLKAKMAFEKGIDTVERFEEVFMGTKEGGDTNTVYSFGDNAQLLVGGSHNAMINVEGGAGAFIKNELKKGGVTDQQIAYIEPEIAEISAEHGKETVNEDKIKTALLIIKDKLGSFVRDIAVQVISTLFAGKISGR
jgi:hypothetical protein